MQKELAPELAAALKKEGTIYGPSYVLIDIDVYRTSMGRISEADLEDSLKAIEAGWQSAQTGNSRPARDVLDDLCHKYDVPS